MERCRYKEEQRLKINEKTRGSIMRLLAKVVALFFCTAIPVMAEVRLWHSNTTTDGNMGGRAGADAICDADANKPAGLPNVRAFISIDSSDEVRDMAANYGIPTSEEIRNQDDSLRISVDFAGLLNAAAVNLDNPVVGAGGTPSPWTFSEPDGSLNANNCTAGTSTAGTGIMGNQLISDGRFLSNNTNNCTAGQALYCISWSAAVAPAAVQAVPATTSWSFVLFFFALAVFVRKRFPRIEKSQ